MKTEKERQLADLRGGGGGWARSRIIKPQKAWSSINHSILSGSWKPRQWLFLEKELQIITSTLWVCISTDSEKGSKKGSSYVLLSVPDPRHFETDPDPWSGSYSFRQWLSRCQQKFLFKVFCLCLSVGTFTSVFKDNKSVLKPLNSWNQGFS